MSFFDKLLALFSGESSVTAVPVATEFPVATAVPVATEFPVAPQVPINEVDSQLQTFRDKTNDNAK